MRFFFYKNDHEPIHVHVEYQGCLAKIRVYSEVELVYNHGIKAGALKKALDTTTTYQSEIISEWYKNFPKL